MAWTVETFTGTIGITLGSAASDIGTYLAGTTKTGTVHGVGIITRGDGKYFQGWAVTE